MQIILYLRAAFLGKQIEPLLASVTLLPGDGRLTHTLSKVITLSLITTLCVTGARLTALSCVEAVVVLQAGRTLEIIEETQHGILAGDTHVELTGTLTRLIVTHQAGRSQLLTITGCC